jgi:hypothetical protein
MKQDVRFCATADSVRLAYAVSGEGPPLVMSATWLKHLEHHWRSLAWRPWLDIFSRDYKLLWHDARRLLTVSRSGRHSSDRSRRRSIEYQYPLVSWPVLGR